MKKILFLLAGCISAFFYPKNTLPPTGEPHRPSFHFTPPAKWMNDPNGLVFFEGEYHLFYQYFPDSTVWGPMHWGHAVSKDMFHWEHLPIALYPDSLGLIFSGSAVVDWQNTSGLGKNGAPPLVAIFTQHSLEKEQAGRKDFESQSLAYSIDKGRTWTKYAGNPVIPHTGKYQDFRDPKIIWDKDSKQWIMALAVYDHIKFWGSSDLKNWRDLSDFGKEYSANVGVWECPDFFPMTVAGSDEQKWVLLQSFNPGNPNGGSGTRYFVGNFDGKKFTIDPQFAKNIAKNPAWLDVGRDNYAGVTWSDVPQSDGRRIFLGWMSNWDYATVVPTKNWRSAMTLPRQLVLKNTEFGYRIFQQPVKEFELLCGAAFSFSNQKISDSWNVSEKLGIKSAVSEVILQVEIPEQDSSAVFGVQLSNSKGETYKIGYDAPNKQFFSDRRNAGISSFSDKFASKIHVATRLIVDKKMELRLVFDKSSCELFADGGATAMTDIFFPSEDFDKISIFTDHHSSIVVQSAKIWTLKN